MGKSSISETAKYLDCCHYHHIHTHSSERTAGHVSKYEKKKERAAELQLTPKNYKRQGCLKEGWNVIRAARELKEGKGKSMLYPPLGRFLWVWHRHLP